MHIYTKKDCKGPQQVLNLSTKHSKLSDNPTLTFNFAIVAHFFPLKSFISCTLSDTALAKVLLEAHQKMLKRKFQERTVEVIWSQEPNISLQFWIRSALAPSI